MFDNYGTEHRKEHNLLKGEHQEIKNLLNNKCDIKLYDTFVAEYRKEHQVLKDVFINKVALLDKWQAAQEAIFKDREKLNSWRIAVVTCVLIAIEIGLRFLH